MKRTRRRGFFRLTWTILLLSTVIFALDLMVILQLTPVFEQDDLFSDTLNLVVFPGNFLFEDVLGITSLTIVDMLTWIVQFFYAFFIACILRRIMRVRVKI